MTLQSVLFVEPELPVRHHVAEYLRQCGFKVYEAFNTDEAVALLEKGEVSVDVVVADVSSPGIVDGFGLSRWIKEKKPETKVLLAKSVEKVAAQAAQLCEEGPLLSKPYHPQVLQEVIVQQLAAHKRAKKSEED